MATIDSLPPLLLLFVAVTHQKILSQILFEVAGDWGFPSILLRTHFDQFSVFVFFFGSGGVGWGEGGSFIKVRIHVQS